MEIEKKFKIRKGHTLPLGVSISENVVNISLVLNNEKECRVNLYLKGAIDKSGSIFLSKEFKTGNIFAVELYDFDFSIYEYMFEVKGKEFIDPYAKFVSGRDTWGKYLSEDEKKLVRGAFSVEEYNWGEDKTLDYKYSDLILYRLHVRGFTNHTSSKVKHKGTYLGIIEKIPYLKELGINAIELLPIHDFDEIIKQKQSYGIGMFKHKESEEKYKESEEKYKESEEKYKEIKKSELKSHEVNKCNRINYWGYAEVASYFSPKSSYAFEPKNAINELKTMIDVLHENGIEVILEMNFAPMTNHNLIFDCLRYWTLEYHVDGFKLNADVVPTTFIATDPILSHVKLFAAHWNTEAIYNKDYTPEYKNLGEYNDDFLVDIRKYLKGDEAQVNKFLFRNKRNPLKHGVINYITNTNGFTLMDLVSYDIKHNEKNGEDNKDGTEYNFSWNCGVEGKTRRKKIVGLRRQQIKNAFLELILSQGTPLILAGDEFGNSQEGNNNSYCQDNDISWLNWNLVQTNQDILQFTKQVIALRKEHPILRKEEEFRVMDYISCGYPDISYHGSKAWYPDFSNYSRVLGIMLCGKYVKIDRNKEDDFFYFAFNMHWEKIEFDLPILPTNVNWYVLIDTSTNSDLTDDKKLKGIANQRKYVVKERSVVVFIGKIG